MLKNYLENSCEVYRLAQNVQIRKMNDDSIANPFIVFNGKGVVTGRYSSLEKAMELLSY